MSVSMSAGGGTTSPESSLEVFQKGPQLSPQPLKWEDGGCLVLGHLVPGKIEGAVVKTVIGLGTGPF